tara:strand:- start:506 stop:898 length:393 start_codon:yes stop_codon:yes gene_type:complete
MRNYKLVLQEMPPKEIRGNSRAHWRTVRRINRERREDAKLLALVTVQEADKTLTITPIESRVLISYEFYHWKPIDLDNLIFGMKSTLDGIVDSGVVSDDAPHLAKIEAEFFKQPKKDNDSKVIVSISEIG